MQRIVSNEHRRVSRAMDLSYAREFGFDPDVEDPDALEQFFNEGWSSHCSSSSDSSFTDPSAEEDDLVAYYENTLSQQSAGESQYGQSLPK